MFLPTTSEELKKRAWNRLDIILVTGDAYIDSPHIGVAVIGRVLAYCRLSCGHYRAAGYPKRYRYSPAGRTAIILGHHRRLHGFHGGQLHGDQKKEARR